MPWHLVSQGECVTSIAHLSGLKWKTIWLSPENSDLRSLRADPNALLPGDRLFIPERDLKEESCTTGSLHRFALTVESCRLSVRLRRSDNTPRSDLRYAIVVDGRTVTQGTTGSAGELEARVPPTATCACLLVYTEKHVERITLKIGHLDPASTISGVQARLVNLGFFAGPVDGNMSAPTRKSLLNYQRAKQLPESGEADEATWMSLRNEHGS